MKNIFISSFFAVIILLESSCKKELDDREPTENPVQSSEIILLSILNNANSELRVLNSKGELLRIKQIPHNIWNFQKWDVNGTTRFTYSEKMEIPGTFGAGSAAVWNVILDNTLNEVKRVSLLDHNGVTYNNPGEFDFHDFILIDDNHYIGVAYESMVVNNIPSSLNPVPNCKVVATIIQEVKNEKVVWEWVSTNYPEFYSTSVEGNAFSDSIVMHDYLHINSVFIDPNDKNLICSFRHANQVVKLSRSTGNIIWRLGGNNSDFVLTPGMKFLRQHHANLTDDKKHLVLFDNGDSIERPYSRVVEFGLDEATKGINFFRAVDLPNKIFGRFTGSAQRIGQTYFVGCGNTRKFIQIDYTTEKVLLEDSFQYQSYRVLRY